jgi:hypothetical protein
LTTAKSAISQLKETMAPNTIPVKDVRAYVMAQIREQQVEYMTLMERGAEGDLLLARAAAAVIDKLYEFASLFWGESVPAPGQGYEPPLDVWAQVKRDRELETIDQQIDLLKRQRQAILDLPKP